MAATQQVYNEGFAGNAPENYERFFVPAIGRPVAEDLIRSADLESGERLLDVACGTGVVTRLAAAQVGTEGKVAGLDVNPGMLAVARETTPPSLAIEWHEASAEAMALPDEVFDVALCQMGLQFVPNKLAALREMRRVLVPGGRLLLNLPGPKPPLFAVMADALARHFGAEAAGFVDLVFSMHDPDELRDLLRGAGFRDVEVEAKVRKLGLPRPADFLWQYIYSTPMAGVAARADEEKRDALERDVSAGSEQFVMDGSLQLEVQITTAKAFK